MINFKNKKILVTGATGGIGREIVKKFSSLEGSIVATGTNIEKLDLLKKDFPNVNVIKFDISEHSRIEEFIENVNLELGGLDILINNAGTNKDNLSLYQLTYSGHLMKYRSSNLASPLLLTLEKTCNMEML